jgi:hypothetical protein
MPNYTRENTSILKPTLPQDDQDLATLRRRNNPLGEPVGPFTGRCAHCGSSNLWDDNLAYGCNACGALLGGN